MIDKHLAEIVEKVRRERVEFWRSRNGYDPDDEHISPLNWLNTVPVEQLATASIFAYDAILDYNTRITPPEKEK